MSSMHTGNGSQHGRNVPVIPVEVLPAGSPLIPSQLAKDAAQYGFDATVLSMNQNNAQQAASAWDSINTSSNVLGVDASKLKKARCYLIMLVLDDSGSMNGHQSAILAGAKTFIEQYQEGRRSQRIQSDVLVAVGTLNRGVIVPYTEVQNFNVKDLEKFEICGGTPLYDVANSALTLQIAKTVELKANGINSKTLTVLMTDGADLDSKLTSAQLKPVITGLADRHGSSHIVSGFYVGNAAEGVFEGMGIKPEWILKSAHDAASLMDTFSRLSRLSMNALQVPPQNGNQIRGYGL